MSKRDVVCRFGWQVIRVLSTSAGVASLLGACASAHNTSTSSSGSGVGGGGGATAQDELVFESAEFDIPPSKEMYVCTTMVVPNATAIDRFTFDATPGVHHLALVNPIVAEAAGSFECDVLFKQTWVPIFANGTGSADVSTPPGSGFKLHDNEQLLIQLHLLNPTNTDIKGTAKLRMHKNADPNLMGAGIYAFGDQTFMLPPQMTSSVTSDCALDKDINVFAVFPHMHQLGTSMTFWTGPDANSLTKQFTVDTWTFAEQKIYPLPLNLSKGTATRVTCDYDNTTSAAVGFGEHTSDEMCYFIAFIAPFDQLDGCLN